jgi:hypothetical protein
MAEIRFMRILMLLGSSHAAARSDAVLDDSTELTGQEAMVRAGARNLAGRVARAVRAGGVANNFPTP